MQAVNAVAVCQQAIATCYCCQHGCSCLLAAQQRHIGERSLLGGHACTCVFVEQGMTVYGSATGSSAAPDAIDNQAKAWSR